MREAKRDALKRFCAKHHKMIRELGIVLALLAFGTGSTFAWFIASDSALNKMDSARVGEVVIYEEFVAPTNWIPGEEVDKKVAAANESEQDVLVRMSFEEFLDKYSGEPGYKTAPLSGTDIPLAFDNAKYTTANGWKAPSAYGFTTTSLPADVAATILVRETVITTVTSPSAQPTSGYQFVFWYPITAGDYAGTLQTASADFYLDGTDIKIAGTARYYYYPARVSTSTAWADLFKPQLTPPAAVESPLLTASEIGHSALSSKITFLYDAIALTPTQDKWFYNADDGFFYFIGKVKPGEKTPFLLASVTLDSTADRSFADMNYNLLINSEAIQNIEAALTSPVGWDMDPVKPNTIAIKNALSTANAFGG